MIPPLTAQIGERFGHLAIIEGPFSSSTLGRDHHGGTWVRVRCDCGIRKAVRLRHLTSGRIRSCGCQQYRKAEARGQREFAAEMRGQG